MYERLYLSRASIVYAGREISECKSLAHPIITQE